MIPLGGTYKKVIICKKLIFTIINKEKKIHPKINKVFAFECKFI
jgi:hypothetical protein